MLPAPKKDTFYHQAHLPHNRNRKIQLKQQPTVPFGDLYKALIMAERKASKKFKAVKDVTQGNRHRL
jgi:hypothetical protein